MPPGRGGSKSATRKLDLEWLERQVEAVNEGTFDDWLFAAEIITEQIPALIARLRGAEDGLRERDAQLTAYEVRIEQLEPLEKQLRRAEERARRAQNSYADAINEMRRDEERIDKLERVRQAAERASSIWRHRPRPHPLFAAVDAALAAVGTVAQPSQAVLESAPGGREKHEGN
jgi:chromosome segregation ATPase